MMPHYAVIVGLTTVSNNLDTIIGLIGSFKLALKLENIKTVLFYYFMIIKNAYTFQNIVSLVGQFTVVQSEMLHLLTNTHAH